MANPLEFLGSFSESDSDGCGVEILRNNNTQTDKSSAGIPSSKR